MSDRLEQHPEKHALGLRPGGWVPVFHRATSEAFARGSSSNAKLERDDDFSSDYRVLASQNICQADTPTAATWTAFLLMCLGMFMAILDIQVVATSLPTIQSALGISQDAMSWIQTAYLIAEVIAIPLTGLLTRVFTLRRLFVAAVGLFTVASIGCALSGSFAVLLAFRVMQGFSGGVLIPAVFSAVFLLFPARLHAVATTIGGVVAVLAPTIGPVVGGFITETWSWP